MNLRFTNWYTQALGATLGIIACMYSYLNGDMIIYSNIDVYFDTLGFGGILSSYLLLPLCIVTLMLAVIKSYALNKTFFKISVENFNIGIIISTVIIGFIGAKIYFTIPAIFILFNLLTYKKINQLVENDEDQKECEEEIINQSVENNVVSVQRYVPTEENDFNDYTLVFKKSKSLESKQLRSKKVVMAKELLEKNAEKQFISEITGLTIDDLNKIEKE